MEASNRRKQQAQRWWENLKSSSNACFLPLYFDEHRYLVLMGGGGSGKSIFAGRKVLERVTSERGHRFLVCRKVARTLRDSCFAQLVGQISKFYPFAGAKINRSELRIAFGNGSEILFAGLDDPEKLKSIYDITGIWVEEASELNEGDFNQLDIRLRTRFPHYLQMILTFNPISVSHWLKRRFFDTADPRALTHRSTYQDNRFLPASAVETLEGFRLTDEYYYQVYCLGQWGVTGKTVFSASAVSARLAKLPEPADRGFFRYREEADGLHITDIQWVPDENGPVTLFSLPEPGVPYVIGGDTAGEGSDWFVGQVLDNLTGKQVAVLRSQYDEDTYAKQLYCLGRCYNQALIGIEVNYSTYPVKLLGLMDYPRLYVRDIEDSFTGELRHSYGFCTTSLTRPVILSELIRVMRDHTELVCHRETLEEMLSFVRNSQLRPEAAPGTHDDCVMALAIAHYIRPQQSMHREQNRDVNRSGWTEDMWQDYRASDAEGRAYLMEKWGAG